MTDYYQWDYDELQESPTLQRSTTENVEYVGFDRYAFRNEMKLLFLVVHTDLGFRTTAAISMERRWNRSHATETARRVPRKNRWRWLLFHFFERKDLRKRTSRCRNNKQPKCIDLIHAHPIVWLHQSWFFRVFKVISFIDHVYLNFCHSTWMFLVINKYKQNSVPVNVLTPFSMINKKPSDLVKTPYPFVHSTSFNHIQPPSCVNFSLVGIFFLVCFMWSETARSAAEPAMNWVLPPRPVPT